MTTRQAIAVIIYSLFCFFLSLVVVECSGREARRDIQAAREETHEARAELAAVKAENNVLREYTQRANEAVLRATRAVEEALSKHDERRQSIDNSNTGWLMCELPDGVRNAFADYNKNGDSNTAVCASASMHKAEGIQPED